LQHINSFIHSFLATLGVHSAKRKHKSPEWTILSHVMSHCFTQGEYFKSCWIVFIHTVWVSQRSSSVLQGGSC